MGGEINEEAFWRGAAPEASGQYKDLVVAGQGAYSIVAKASHDIHSWWRGFLTPGACSVIHALTPTDSLLGSSLLFVAHA